VPCIYINVLDLALGFAVWQSNIKRAAGGYR